MLSSLLFSRKSYIRILSLQITKQHLVTHLLLSYSGKLILEAHWEKVGFGISGFPAHIPSCVRSMIFLELSWGWTVVARGRRLLAITEACGNGVSTEGGSVGRREGMGVRDSREGEFKGLRTGDKNWS